MEIPMNNQKGFTLVELVAVIVILGALAVTAIPQFVDLQDEADQAALDGVAGSMASGMAVNYAGCSAVGHDAGKDECSAVTNCTDVSDTLQNGVPDGYSVTSSNIGSSNGDTGDCTVEATAPGISKDFKGIVAGQ